MSDIQPGDVVVCVGADWPLRYAKNLRTALPVMRQLTNGRFYRVEEVRMSVRGTPALRLFGLEHGIYSGFDPARFRKIRPADPEFVSLIKRVKIGEKA